jgi:hypothetical protein
MMCEAYTSLKKVVKSGDRHVYCIPKEFTDGSPMYLISASTLRTVTDKDKPNLTSAVDFAAPVPDKTIFYVTLN